VDVADREDPRAAGLQEERVVAAIGGERLV
jgi:hypothetical protein